MTIRVFVLDPQDAIQEPTVGWVVDRSHGGVCLAYTRRGLKLGDVLMIQRPSARDDQPWVEVRIRNGRWRKSQLELGCELGQNRDWADALLQ